MLEHKKILIIEDDFMVREVISTMLECEEFEVIQAEEGYDGITLAKQCLPDLILCDIMMPNLSGYDVLKRLGETDKTAAIPFIFVSAKSQKNDVRLGMELGADDYISKPFTRNELVSAVKTRLKKQAERQHYYDEKISQIEEKLIELEQKINHLLYADSEQIFTPTQGWQGRFEQVIMTADKIITMTGEITEAIEREEFQLHYQPQVDIRTGEIIGLEALLRWQHHERGMISPVEFIPIAEAKGLIVPLGDWVLKTVCQNAKKWQDMGYFFRRVAANISAQQLQQPNFGSRLLEIIMETGLSPQYLELELTESMVVQNIEQATNVFQQIKNMGVQIGIDDFGTGYSSLSYLNNFDFDTLKIDRSFVHNLDKQPKKQAMLQLMISLGHTLSLKVLAEGVETEAELSILKELHCDEFQGYLFSRPLPASEIEVLLQEYQKPGFSQKPGF
jgi:EAL domain-containing protein (putative c-di-GMP-specific phosphodiesterase class I)/DNA-binding response OmpR family regulator